MRATVVSYPFVSFVLCSFLFCLFVLQLNKFEMKSRLSRFIAEDPLDLLLPREEAIKLSTEAFRLWAVAAGYGQACDLYRYSPKLELAVCGQQSPACMLSEAGQCGQTVHAASTFSSVQVLVLDHQGLHWAKSDLPQALNLLPVIALT